eukprot:Gb_20953 [translate_table: standard]
MDTVLYSPMLLWLSQELYGSLPRRDFSNDHTRGFYRTPYNYVSLSCRAYLEVQTRLWEVGDTSLDSSYKLYGTHDSECGSFTNEEGDAKEAQGLVEEGSKGDPR